MAAEAEGQGQDKGGGAVDGLTPPTMQYSDDRTMVGSSPTVAPSQNTIPASQNTIQAPGSGTLTSKQSISKSSPGRSVAGQNLGPDTLPAGVVIVDLLGEKLLQQAPRIEFHGQMCPALNGIPMLRKLGQGGMGAVYYGIHPRLRSEVAIKVLPFHLAEQDPGMIQRFFREAQIAAQVRSPYLVNVTDVNEESGLIFLIMEYVSGLSAGQYLKAALEKGEKGLVEIEAVQIMIAATEGLCAAHSHGVIHRDLKPDNIMIPATRNAKGFELTNAKLMDLGLARNEESNQSLTGGQAAMGTPGYMAPEQAMDAKTADKRSDVFGMGATMYALLNGKPPFADETIMKVLMKTMHEPHVPILTIRPEISPALNDVLERCLNKKQDQRYANAQALLKAFQNVQRGLPAPEVEGGQDPGDPKTFVYNAGTGPGSGVDQKTHLGASGLGSNPGTGPGGSMAPPKSKGMMYVAAGVAAVVLGGGAFMMMGKKADPQGSVAGTNGGGGGDTGKVAPIEKIPILAENEAAAQRKRYMSDIESAKESAATGDIVTARGYLKDLQDIPIHKTKEAKLVEAYEAVEKSIKVVEGQGKFKREMISIGRLMSSTDLTQKDIDGIQDTLSKLDGWDAASKQKLAEVIKDVDIRKKDMKQRESAAVVLGEVRKLDAQKLEIAAIDDTIAKLEPVKKNFPTTDAIHKEVLALESKLSGIKQDKQNNIAFDALMKGGAEAEKSQNFAIASEKYLEARRLVPTRAQEATERFDLVKGKLDDAAKTAILDKAKKDYAAIMVTVQDKLREKDFQGADQGLEKALRLGIFNEKHPEIESAKKLIVAGMEEQKALKAEQEKKQKFATIIADGNRMLANEDFDEARKKVVQAKELYKDDALAAKLDDAINQQQEVKRVREQYDGLLNKARTALREEDENGVDQAETFVRQAMQIVADGPAALKIQADIKARKTDLAAKKTVIGRLDTSIKAAEAFATEGDKRPLGSFDKITQYETSASKFAEMRAIKVDQPDAIKMVAAAGAKEKDVLSKLTAAKAEYATRKKQFEDKMKSIDQTAAAGDPAAALKMLPDVKNLLVDDRSAGERITEREETFKKAIADGEKYVTTAIQQAAGKLTQRDLEGAMLAVQTARGRFPGRKELGEIEIGLKTLQGFTNKVRLQLSTADSRISESKRKLSTAPAAAAAKGADRIATMEKSRSSIELLGAQALDAFAKSNFKDAGLPSLTASLDKESGAVELAAMDLNDVIRAAAPPPPPPPVRVSQPVERQPERKPAPRPSVGENNPFE